MKKILYVGQIAIEGSASCTHVQNRARFFTNIGYNVYGLSECPKDKNDKANNTNFIKYIYILLQFYYSITSPFIKYKNSGHRQIILLFWQYPEFYIFPV